MVSVYTPCLGSKKHEILPLYNRSGSQNVRLRPSSLNQHRVQAQGCRAAAATCTNSARVGHPHTRRRMEASSSMQCYKTKLCSFYAQGKCERGSNCTFAHHSDEIRLQPDLVKTKICAEWRRGMCFDLYCSFAHGEKELRSDGSCFKTSMCYRWQQKDGCRIAKCPYAHSVDELRTLRLVELDTLMAAKNTRKGNPEYYSHGNQELSDSQQESGEECDELPSCCGIDRMTESLEGDDMCDESVVSSESSYLSDVFPQTYQSTGVGTLNGSSAAYGLIHSFPHKECTCGRKTYAALIESDNQGAHVGAQRTPRGGESQNVSATDEGVTSISTTESRRTSSFSTANDQMTYITDDVNSLRTGEMGCHAVSYPEVCSTGMPRGKAHIAGSIGTTNALGCSYSMHHAADVTSPRRGGMWHAPSLNTLPQARSLDRCSKSSLLSPPVTPVHCPVKQEGQMEPLRLQVALPTDKSDSASMKGGRTPVSLWRICSASTIDEASPTFDGLPLGPYSHICYCDSPTGRIAGSSDGENSQADTGDSPSNTPSLCSTPDSFYTYPECGNVINVLSNESIPYPCSIRSPSALSITDENNQTVSSYSELSQFALMTPSGNEGIRPASFTVLPPCRVGLSGTSGQGAGCLNMDGQCHIVDDVSTTHGANCQKFNVSSDSDATPFRYLMKRSSLPTSLSPDVSPCGAATAISPTFTSGYGMPSFPQLSLPVELNDSDNEFAPILAKIQEISQSPQHATQVLLAANPGRYED